jgi:hypothetical protein
MNSVVVKAGVAQAKREGLWVGKILIWVFVLGAFVVGPFEREYDKRLRERPFVSAFVGIVPVPDGKPQVQYLASAPVHVEGRWSAWVSVDGRRGCGGGGQAGYGPPPNKQKVWEWADWLGNDCPIPDQPFSLCVRYAVKTNTGVGDISGPFCSETYGPRGRIK